MKTINLYQSFRNLFTVFFTLMLLGFIVSCGGNDDEGGDGNGAGINSSHYKITVTLNGVNATDDYVSVVASGGNHQNDSSLWKINGAVQNGQTVVGLNKNSFSGATKSYTIETNTPIAALSASIQVINFNSTITGTYKIEKDNQLVVNETINLTADGADFTKNYTF
ncbi:hypothetical protein CHFL109739_06440 [Chryseobacterium flavum]|nr:hypothetical protein [Chryseobacterium flavum]